MSAKLVLIDTSAWIEYLKKTSHPITNALLQKSLKITKLQDTITKQ